MNLHNRYIALLIAVAWGAVSALADGIRITHGPYLQNVTET